MLHQMYCIQSPTEKEESLDRCKARLRSAVGMKRSFRMEVRLIHNVELRRKYEVRLATLDRQLQTLQIKYDVLESELHRGVPYLAVAECDGQKAGDKMLKEASQLQDKTEHSLTRIKEMIADSRGPGVSSRDDLEGGVIEAIDKDADRMDNSLARSEALLKRFRRVICGGPFIRVARPSWGKIRRTQCDECKLFERIGWR